MNLSFNIFVDFGLFTTYSTPLAGFLMCVFQDAFAAFHPDPKFVQKFLKPLLIGELAATEPSQDRNKNVRLTTYSSNKALFSFRAKVQYVGKHLRLMCSSDDSHICSGKSEVLDAHESLAVE